MYMAHNSKEIQNTIINPSMNYPTMRKNSQILSFT